MTLALEDDPRLRVRRRALQLARDPLANQLFASAQQREMFRAVRDAEVLFRAANKAAKTWGGADLSLCFLRGKKAVDGRTLHECRDGAEPWALEVPPIRTPCVGWCFVAGYKQSVDSVIEALRDRLGGWDHRWVSSGGPIGFSALHVRPDAVQSADWRHKWSRLVFWPSDGQEAPGGTVDFVWADEPPPAFMWDEARNRRRAGHPFYRFITATPIKKYGPTGWEWLRKSFESGLEGRVQLVSSVYDNQALTPEDIREQELANADSPYRRARLFGEWVDTSGQCPYRAEHLDRWRARCRKPRVDVVPILEHAQEGEREVLPISAELEVWHDFEANHTYRLVADPAGGIKDEDHDPEAFHVINETRGCLAARHKGYLEPYALGVLIDSVGRRYGNARADVEMNRYGDTVVLALRKRYYPNIGTTQVIDTPGKFRDAYGFTATEVNRAQGIGAIQRALAEDSFLCESEEVVSCLANIVLDRNGKPVADRGKAHHDEDQTCLGWALRQLTLSPPPPLPGPETWTPEDIMRRELGILRRRTIEIPRQRWR